MIDHKMTLRFRTEADVEKPEELIDALSDAVAHAGAIPESFSLEEWEAYAQLNPSESLDAIQRLLDGKEWGPDTTAGIAEIIRASGRVIRDVR